MVKWIFFLWKILMNKSEFCQLLKHLSIEMWLRLFVLVLKFDELIAN
jgi:hypothetical protein